MYKINEIFYSLQGEGYHTGTAAVFVRFAGCNLHCKWCDTDFRQYTEMTAEDIAAHCKSVSQEGTRLLVLTGGEPSLQVDETLLKTLHKAGFYIAIETNGTHTLPDGIDWITCSPKESTDIALTEANELKIVYTGQDVEKWRKLLKADNYFLQPCSCQNNKEVTEYILRHPTWRLSVQTHKYIGIR